MGCFQLVVIFAAFSGNESERTLCEIEADFPAAFVRIVNEFIEDNTALRSDRQLGRIGEFKFAARTVSGFDDLQFANRIFPCERSFGCTLRSRRNRFPDFDGCSDLPGFGDARG